MKARTLATTIASLLITLPAFAITDTWDGGGGNNNLTTNLNWLDDSAPASDLVNTDLIFAGIMRLMPNLSAPFSTNSLTFNNTAGAFTFGGSVLTIGVGGIVNNDADTQTFGNTVAIGTGGVTFNAASGPLNFTNNVNLGGNGLTVTGASNTTLSLVSGAGTITKTGPGILNFAPPAAYLFDLVVNTGSVQTLAGTTATFSSSSAVQINGTSIFGALDHLTLDGANFTRASGATFALGVGRTLTIQNSGSFAFTGSQSFGGSRTISIASGGDLTSTAAVDLGTSVGTTTVTVDGTASLLSAVSTSTWGAGGTAAVTFSNTAAGNFGALVLADTPASSTATVNVQSGADITSGNLTIGNSGVGGNNATVTVTGTSSTWVQSGAAALTIGAASGGAGTLNVNSSGTFTTGTGLTTVNATGAINLNVGIFTLNGDLLLNGGAFASASGGLVIPTPRSITVQAGGDLTLPAQVLFLGGTSSLTVTGAGSTAQASSFQLPNSTSALNISAGGVVTASGASGNLQLTGGTLTVDGSGSQFNANGPSTSSIGTSGQSASATFSNNAAGSFVNTLFVPASGAGNANGTLLVQSGADLTTNSLFIGSTPFSSSGNVTVTGAGSTITLTGTSIVFVGASTSGTTGTLNVNSGGVFNTGTGASVIANSGVLSINGGTFNASGNLTLSGGQITRDATGAFTLAAGQSLSVQQGGDAIITGDFTNATASSIVVTGGGSTFSTTGALSLIGGSTTTVSSGGVLSSNGNPVNIGTNGDGTVTVIGGGFAGGDLVVGQSGTGSLTFSNGGGGVFGNIQVDASFLLGTSGTMLVQSGAFVSATGLSISPNSVGNNGLVAVLGASSRFILTGAATTSIGTFSSDVGTLEALDGGAFTSGTGTVSLNATGVINIDGGSVNLLGPLARNGGALNFTAGSLSIINNWNVGTGGLLGTNVTFDATRQMATSAATIIDTFRTLTLNGGTLSTGALANNGTLAFNSGTLAVTGAGGFNIGTGALGANVALGAGANLQVTNTATVASGATLTLNGGGFIAGALDNTGTIRVNLGTAATASGTNNNGGRIFIGDTLDVAGAFTNASGGRITLEDGAGLLSGAGALNNSGLITGDGTIAKPLTNSATGEVRGELGRTLSFTAAATNSGQFNLLGGTLDFASTVTNDASGFISGHGALFTGGLANAGVIAISSGNADIRGDVTISTGARVATSGAGVITTFYDDVVHNGLEIFTGANASTVFYGSQSGAGPFTGTGTVYFIGDLRPGNSPASVSYGGDVAFGGASSLLLEIGGLAVGTEYDHLDIAGTLHVDGDFTLALLDGFIPQFGDTFDLLDASAVVGSFDDVNLPALGGDLEWDATDLQSTGEIRVVPEPGIGALLLSALALLGVRRPKERR